MNNFFNFRNQDITYTVKKGDSLYKIAKQFDTSIDNLMSLNELHNQVLHEGQVLYIKKDSKIEHIGSDICNDTIIKDDMAYDNYIVKEGDSLYKIANQFQTNISNLIYINNLKNKVLSIGQKLKVPKGNKKTIKYIVKSGDTLYSIASDYHITPKQIITANNLTNQTLEVGQQLIIPN